MPPPPPPAPPPPPTFALANTSPLKLKKSEANERGALLSAIRQIDPKRQLRKVQTNDRSAPTVAGGISGSGHNGSGGVKSVEPGRPQNGKVVAPPGLINLFGNGGPASSNLKPTGNRTTTASTPDKAPAHTQQRTSPPQQKPVTTPSQNTRTNHSAHNGVASTGGFLHKQQASAAEQNGVAGRGAAPSFPKAQPQRSNVQNSNDSSPISFPLDRSAGPGFANMRKPFPKDVGLSVGNESSPSREKVSPTDRSRTGPPLPDKPPTVMASIQRGRQLKAPIQKPPPPPPPKLAVGGGSLLNEIANSLSMEPKEYLNQKNSAPRRPVSATADYQHQQDSTPRSSFLHNAPAPSTTSLPGVLTMPRMNGDSPTKPSFFPRQNGTTSLAQPTSKPPPPPQLMNGVGNKTQTLPRQNNGPSVAPPPPPPHRMVQPPTPSNHGAPPSGSGAPPPPPQRFTSNRLGPVNTNMNGTNGNFESRFLYAFHSVEKLPPPEPFTGCPKESTRKTEEFLGRGGQNSKRHQTKRQQAPPPPQTVGGSHPTLNLNSSPWPKAYTEC